MAGQSVGVCRVDLRPPLPSARFSDRGGLRLKAACRLSQIVPDDEQLNYQRAESALFDFSLESRLAEHYSAIGPFIAVGKPGDELPTWRSARQPQRFRVARHRNGLDGASHSADRHDRAHSLDRLGIEANY